MKRIFLFRAYGDCIVALQSIINSPLRAQCEIIASLHHQPLFDALPAEMIPADLNIQFVDWGIRTPLLRAFSNRYLLHAGTRRELAAIRSFLRNHPAPSGGDWVEQPHRKQLLELGTKHRFHSIADDGPVYTAFHRFFHTVDPEICFADDGLHVAGPQNILVLPSARIPRRDLPEPVLNCLKRMHTMKGDRVQLAYFNKQRNKQINKQQPGAIGYNSFSELVQLVQEADFVYGADSLPVHLAQLLLKPHCIVYPEGGSHRFFTPFTLQHALYKTFNEFH
ncbi:MAG: hypothetical protein I8H66_11880 [Sphingobacteriia bacterium]|nr:hypothetical protein [Sphingobacteriia bacterium]